MYYQKPMNQQDLTQFHQLQAIVVPSHFAILAVLATPPAEVKAPPTYMLPESSNTIETYSPVPKLDKLDPSHL